MIEWQSALLGGGITLIVIIIAAFALFGLLFGRMREQLRVVLGQLYSRVSLMLIAIFDVVSAFEPSQTLLGLAVAPIAGLVVWLSEWGLHDKFKKGRLAPSLVEGLIAAVIVAIPLPVAGLFVAWFGSVGYKKGGKK